MMPYWIYRRAPHWWLRMADLVPRRLRYWVVLRAIARASTGALANTAVPEIAAMDVLATKRIYQGEAAIAAAKARGEKLIEISQAMARQMTASEELAERLKIPAQSYKDVLADRYLELERK